MLYEMMHMYLTGRLENGGPAIARDVEWTVSLRGPEKSLGEPRRYAQALMGAGKHRTMLLDPREGGQATTLNQMAEDDVVIDVKWSWTDGRRRWPFGPHTKHQGADRWDCKQLVEDFYQAQVLTETPPMLKVGAAADHVRKAIGALPKIDQRLERIRDGQARRWARKQLIARRSRAWVYRNRERVEVWDMAAEASRASDTRKVPGSRATVERLAVTFPDSVRRTHTRTHKYPRNGGQLRTVRDSE